jgi:hypothetical protein
VKKEKELWRLKKEKEPEPTRLPSFSALEERGEPMRPKKEEAPATNKMCWELELQALARGLWKR